MAYTNIIYLTPYRKVIYNMSMSKAGPNIFGAVSEIVNCAVLIIQIFSSCCKIFIYNQSYLKIFFQ